MRFAVTGSTGLIGSALVADLRAAGHSVTRIVRAPGADLTIGGSVDLTEGTLEARLLLSGTGGAGFPPEPFGQ